MNVKGSNKILNIEFLDKEPDINDNNNFCFVSDNGWNDYGYKTLFQLYYKNPISNEWIYIDAVKLFLSNSDSHDHCTEIVKFKNLNNLVDNDHKVWMIGENSKFYFELKNIINDQNIMSKFLNSMNDLTKKPNELNELKKQESKEDQEKKKGIVERSVFRDYTDSRLIYNAYKLIRENLKDDWNVLDILRVLKWTKNSNYLNNLDSISAFMVNTDENYNFISTIISCIILKNIDMDDIYKKYRNLDPFSFGGQILISEYKIQKNKIQEIELTSDEKKFIEKLQNKFPDKTILNQILNLLKKSKMSIQSIVNDIKEELIIKEDNLSKKKDILSLGQYTKAESIKFLMKPEFNIRDDKTTTTPYQKESYIPSLRFSHANQLNDPLEGRTLINSLIDEESERPKDEVVNIFISSATSSLDSLPMWKDYGDDGKGVVLIYSNEYIEKLLTMDNVNIYRVCYINEEGKVEKISKFDKDDDSQIGEKIKSINEKLTELRTRTEKDIIKIFEDNKELEYVFKKSDYSYENEFRILLNLEGDRNFEYTCEAKNKERYPLPLVYANIVEKVEKDKKTNTDIFFDLEVKYKEVKLGPLCTDKDYLIPYIRLCNSDIENLKISNSKINFRG